MRTLEQFKQLYFKKYPSSNLEILKIENVRHVLVKTKYGICKVDKWAFLNKNNPTIQTAINKNEYFINQAREIHGDKYDYSLVNYTHIHKKIKIICPKHGVFEQTPDKHLYNTNCPKCGKLIRSKNKTKTLEYFIEKANKVHNFRYDYTNSIYTLASKNIKIICPVHGEFEQKVNGHLNGSGCPLCKCEILSKYNSENPSGWSLTNWFNAANKSKSFDSFKVYIIKCYNENEEFYKIGRSFLRIKKRFNKSVMPYNYEIIKIFEFKELTQENCKIVFDLEIKKQNKEFKYLPKIKFHGSKECFTQIRFKP